MEKEKILREYVKSVAKNINKSMVPNEIDLVFSSGAFNGLYGYGVAIFIKELETMNIVKIKRVSGCSIGSLLGLLYIFNHFESIEQLFLKFKRNMKKYGNLKNYKKFITTIVNTLIKNDNDLEILKDKLYITYIDITNCKQIVESCFHSKKHLIECIYKSGYIPFLIDGNLCYKHKYIDGITPYIFKDNKYPSLYVNQIPLSILYKCFFTKDEVNPHYRILLGVTEACKFFRENKSDICSWTSNWNSFDFVLFRLSYLFFMVLIMVIQYGGNINCSYLKTFENNKILLITKTFFSQIIKDITYLII